MNPWLTGLGLGLLWLGVELLLGVGRRGYLVLRVLVLVGGAGGALLALEQAWRGRGPELGIVGLVFAGLALLVDQLLRRRMVARGWLRR